MICYAQSFDSVVSGIHRRSSVQRSSPVKVMLAVMKGTRPPRPTYPTFTEKLWALMQRCWDRRPFRARTLQKSCKSSPRQYLTHFGDRPSVGLTVSSCVVTREVTFQPGNSCSATHFPRTSAAL
jgi:hypothetical protein